MQQINLINMVSNAGLMVQFVLLLLLFFFNYILGDHINKISLYQEGLSGISCFYGTVLEKQRSFKCLQAGERA